MWTLIILSFLKACIASYCGTHGIYNEPSHVVMVQSTLVISNSKGLTETLRDIRTSTYQSWESEENNKFNKHI